jgi:hypothetical protein
MGPIGAKKAARESWKALVTQVPRLGNEARFLLIFDRVREMETKLGRPAGHPTALGSVREGHFEHAFRVEATDVDGRPNWCSLCPGFATMFCAMPSFSIFARYMDRWVFAERQPDTTRK